ncbi:hypothetical protein OO013_11955 [Mangrovivirga sp. M17]|uniref:Uncharacterized protein n=1 Tax=Mangrovivirga halotolerans TaxID=2993936 RepID=A0ABT3RSI5_9BACT|nr:hypothetical protein [Mangrovivirga halotolerans]MCX2744586.1 hypothetical protein [Mangrovivirga halotolerans]
MAIRFLFFALIFSVVGCSEEKSDTYSAYKVHPITHQLQLLDSLNREILPEKDLIVTKTVTYNSKEETVELEEVDWKKELGFLSEFKPEKIFRAKAVDSTVEKLNNGYEKRTYIVTDTSYFNLRKFVVELKEDRITHIGAVINDENILFHTEKVIELDFDPESKRLRSYFYFEEKDMSLRGINEYSIKASIKK